jgi:hypothetical protein
LGLFLEDNQRDTYNYTISDDVIGLLSCKRRAALGADTAAELGSLPISAVSYFHDRNVRRYGFTHPKGYAPSTPAAVTIAWLSQLPSRRLTPRWMMPLPPAQRLKLL